ncbi:MAG: hypothetical protein Q9191_004774 [Dirinaria sp. TL-2023a]
MAFNNTNTDILLAGAFAAFTVDLLVYPLDTIKTRLQSPDYKRLYTNASTKAISPALFRGLYQGVGSVVIATVPSSGAFFTTYESTKSALHALNTLPTSGVSSPLLPTPLIHSLASSTGELVSCFILTPAEVLKQNAQMVRTKSRSSSSSKIFDRNATITALRKFNHPTQLWRGYTALAARNLPFTAMQFPMYEWTRSWTLEYRKRKGVYSGSLLETGTVTAFSAGAAGSLAAVITTPIDVVKTRIMLSAAGSSSEAGNGGNVSKSKLEKATRAQRRGGLAVAREVLRTEGVRGLFRGGALRGLWTALGSGLYLGVYESGRRSLEVRRLKMGGEEGESSV